MSARDFLSSRWLLRTLCFAFAALMLAASFAGAQSGRKTKRPPPQPPVQGVNQPEARTVPESEIEVDRDKPKETGPGIIIASDIPDLGAPAFFADIARQACAAEMRDARFPDIREARDKHRVDASKIAKEDEVYVVHLELRINQFGRPTAGARFDFDLRYTIFEPKTGKMVNAGAGYPAQRNTRQPPIGYDYDQRVVELMGRDAGAKALQFIRENAQRRPQSP